MLRVYKILILITILLSIGFIYLIYTKFIISTPKIILLEAKYKEFKKKPQETGGVIIPYSNSIVYEQLKPGNTYKTTYHLLPEPESPVNIIYEQVNAEDTFDSIDEILNNINQYDAISLIDDDKDAMPISRESNNQQKQKEIIEAETDLIIETVSTALKLNQSLIGKGENDNNYKLQLSTALSEEEAREEWEKLKNKHTKILKDADLILRKIHGKNERIFYLVLAGTYTSLNQAKLACNKLSMHRQNCIITK